MDKKIYENCTLCPRDCGADRSAGKRGVCGQTDAVKLARAALHFWEEPCISGSSGSGAVFFCGCALHCVFCQNRPIASGTAGKEIKDERLSEIFLELQEKGACNINLVTPGHFVPHIIPAVERARSGGLSIPIVYNTGSYEQVDTIRSLEGIVDVYLPDFKYMDGRAAEKYSHAPDYPSVAKAAIAEMVRQQPVAVFEEESGHPENLLMKKGVLVRHLLLPGMLYDSRQILKYLYETYENRIFYSLMSQYTPLAGVQDFPELNARVSAEAYGNLVSFAKQLGIENGYTQEREVADESFIPYFDCEGV
jgi:putative pyruvate formate lyase activating enzyme